MEVDEYLKEYAETFNEGFPMYQLGRNRTDDEVIELIKRCLSEHKSAYELGLVSEDDDIQY